MVYAVTSNGVLVKRSVDTRDGRPGDTVSGPAMMTLIDTTAWLAIMSRIGPVVLAVTTSLYVDFLRKPSLGNYKSYFSMTL